MPAESVGSGGVGSEHAGMSGTGPKIAYESRIGTSDSQDAWFVLLYALQHSSYCYI